MTDDLHARIRAAISAQASARGLEGPGCVETATVSLDAAAGAVMTALERELTPLPDGRLARPQRDRLELALIREHRAEGRTWREIAATLGMNSPQVAHARYQRLVTRESDESRRAGDDPACSECGGRPKRGLVQSEDGETWQCQGCYEDLARGPMPDGGTR